MIVAPEIQSLGEWGWKGNDNGGSEVHWTTLPEGMPRTLHCRCKKGYQSSTSVHCPLPLVVDCVSGLTMHYTLRTLHLEAICSIEPGWDSKTTSEAYGLMKRIADSNCTISNRASFFYCYIRGINVKLQGSTMDVLDSISMVDHVKSFLAYVRNNSDNYFETVWNKMSKNSEKACVTSLEPPRQCSMQTQRNKTPARTSQQYLNMLYSFLFLTLSCSSSPCGLVVWHQKPLTPSLKFCICG